jgi:phosphosulfolactate phosphohydrolase-like enzyme
MAQEIRDGVSESRAMERFGRRCRLLPYLRFSSVITQNLKKGADGIIDILEKESLEALEQRKERVLQLGEMAGTKLLFPMILMLGLVMGIIMVPAFMTM